MNIVFYMRKENIAMLVFLAILFGVLFVWYLVGLAATQYGFMMIAVREKRSIKSMWREAFIFGLLAALLGPINWFVVPKMSE